MSKTDQKSATEVLRCLAEVLNDEGSDADDLIHAFGDIETMRIEVAHLLTTLLEQAGE